MPTGNLGNIGGLFPAGDPDPGVEFMSDQNVKLKAACDLLGVHVDLEARVGWWGGTDRNVAFRAIVYDRNGQPLYATPLGARTRVLGQALQWLAHLAEARQRMG